MNKSIFACGLSLISSSVFAELNVQQTRQDTVPISTPVVGVVATAKQPVAESIIPNTPLLEQSFTSVHTEVPSNVAELVEGETTNKHILGLSYSRDSKPFFVFAEGGIFGFGGGIGFSPNSYIDLTASFNKGSWKDVEFSSLELIDGTKYKLDIDTDVKSLYANIRPFAGSFHLTVGLVNQNNKFNGSIEPSKFIPEDMDIEKFEPEYVFDDAMFDANEVGKVYGSLHYKKKTMPYIGIGWSPALTKRFGLTTQIGALYAGKPTIELYPENGNLAVQDKNHTTTLGVALEAEKEAYNSKLEWFPVAKLGLWLRF